MNDLECFSMFNSSIYGSGVFTWKSAMYFVYFNDRAELRDFFNYIRNYVLLVNSLCEKKLKISFLEVLLN